MANINIFETPADWVEKKQALSSCFSDDWARKYIDMHFHRCLDDVQRVSTCISEGGGIFNVGGAPYIFEYIASTMGLRVQSLDIDPTRHAASIEKLGLGVISGNIEDAEFRAGLDLSEYDVVCLCEVFEHMRIDLLGTLSDIRNSMRRGGVFYLTTPNFYYAPSLLATLRNGRSGPSPLIEWSKLRELGHMGHIREYSAIELEEMFRFVGFDISEKRVRNRSRIVGGNSISSKISLPFTRFLSKNFQSFGQEFVYMLKV